MSAAIDNNDENNTVYYSTRALKYFNPSLFHCYFAAKETFLTLETYLSINSEKDINYNLMYKTGQMFDQVRIIEKVRAIGTFYDRDVYVIAKALGTIINIILSPDLPRIQY